MGRCRVGPARADPAMLSHRAGARGRQGACRQAKIRNRSIGVFTARVSMTGFSKRKAVAHSSHRGRSPTTEAVEMKLVLLGAAGVGKTSIVSRLVRDRFRANEAPTIGAAFSTKMLTVDAPRQQSPSKKRITLGSDPTTPTLVKAVIWDTAGQEKYHSLTPMYYRNATCAIICYDVTSRESFEAAKKWSDELRLLGPQHVVLCVVGNKCDAPQEQREVSTSEADAWSLAIGAVLWEVGSEPQRRRTRYESFDVKHHCPSCRCPPRTERASGGCSRTPHSGYSGSLWRWKTVAKCRSDILSAGQTLRSQRRRSGRVLGGS